jgi:hypothetical protein
MVCEYLSVLVYEKPVPGGWSTKEMLENNVRSNSFTYRKPLSYIPPSRLLAHSNHPCHPFAKAQLPSLDRRNSNSPDRPTRWSIYSTILCESTDIKPEEYSSFIGQPSVLHHNKINMGGHIFRAFWKVWIGRKVACKYFKRVVGVLVNIWKRWDIERCRRGYYQGGLISQE